MDPAVFLAILCLGVALAAEPPDPRVNSEWQEWKTKYNKNYSLEEEGQRRAVWEENRKLIKQHNSESDQGKNGFTLKMNAFGDMTDEEYKKIMADLPISKVRRKKSIQQRIVDRLPKFVDWRRRGYVTSVKNQGTCVFRIHPPVRQHQTTYYSLYKQARTKPWS